MQRKKMQKRVTPPIPSTRTIDFREAVDAATGVEAKKPCPINGYVSAVVIHWPPGCLALVEVAVIHMQSGPGGRQTGIVPTDSGIYLALDNATPVFTLYFPVKKGDYFMLVIRNTDNTFAHTISVDIIVNPSITAPRVLPETPPTIILPEKKPTLPILPPLPEFPAGR